MDIYLKVKEVSDYLSVSSDTVRRWIREGYLQASKLSNKTGYVIKKSDLLGFCLKYHKPCALVLTRAYNDISEVTDPLDKKIQEIEQYLDNLKEFRRRMN